MKRFMWLFIPLGIFFASASLTVLVANSLGSGITARTWFTVVALMGLLPFCLSSSPLQVSPARLFAVSVLMFILSRPLIDLFHPVELIEVGNGISEANLTLALAVLSLSLWVSAIAYSGCVVFFREQRLPVKDDPLTVRIPLFNGFEKGALALFIFLGVAFLLKSIRAASALSAVDYFTAVSDPSFHAHLYLFFLAKMVGLVWVIYSKSSVAIRRYVFMLFVFSLGFLMIGLRGYFVAYAFLFLYAYAERKRLNLLTLVSVFVGMLLISSYIMEYRLGFSIYDSFGDMLILPFYQQGASFEVVFGAVNFSDSVNSCISLADYVIFKKPFGDCVDVARGVPFVEGGFASSFFAEAYYFGVPVLVALSGAIGAAVAYLDRLSIVSARYESTSAGFLAKLLLISVIPNLVYLARSSAFDFLWKLAMTTVMIVFFYVSAMQEPKRQTAAV